MELNGKEIFITAAGQGIGRAIAERFISEGASITATDINLQLLDGLQGAETYQLDVTDKKTFQSMIKKADPDVLVNCAGIVNHGNILDATDEEFSFAVSFSSSFSFESESSKLRFSIRSATS